MRELTSDTSLMVDTACSASLYALHLAVSALRNGDCDAAIVAGSNMILGPEAQMFTTKLGAVSPTSQCHTFDEAADGYARAEGVGALYIKKISDAVAAGDPIRATIRGTAFNSNGKTGGISHPSPEGQEAVIRQAYKQAGGLDPNLTGYFECHGTGTPVGDPLEVAALGRVFAYGRRDDPLLIGSIKTNLGHSEAASALSQLMKAVLCIEHGEIPATIGIKKFNPAIDFVSARARVVQEMTPWPANKLRRVSINSFGYGGANAHAILEHPSHILPGYKLPGMRLSARKMLSSVTNGHSNGLTNGHTNGNAHDLADGYTNGCSNGHGNGIKQHYISWLERPELKQTQKAGTRKLVLLPFSAHDDNSLKANIAATADAANDFDLANVAYTLASRRTRFSRRGFAIADSHAASESLKKCILAFGKTGGSRVQRIGFVFTGQGAQWPEMGAKLIDEYQVFRDSIRYLDGVLQKLGRRPSWTIEEALLEPTASSRLQEPEFSQTVCTALQIALVSLLRTWGIEPIATVGHSSGEMAAAYAAGRLSAGEAIIFAYFRGQAVLLNQRQGRMMAVGLGPDKVEPYLEGLEQDVRIAAVNSPESVTLSGEVDPIMELNKRLDTDKVFNRVLKTGGTAYHSHHMKLLGETFEQEASRGLRELEPEILSEPVRPLVKWVSSVTPEKAVKHATPAYWRQNLESPVLFCQAVQALARDTPIDLLIELGPHPALGGPLKQIHARLEEQGIELPPCLATIRRGEHDVISMLTLGGNLFLHNAPVDLVAINATEKEHHGRLQLRHGFTCIDMPQYKYNYPGKNIYYENRWNKEFRMRKYPRHDLLGVKQPGCSRTHPSWRNVLRLKDLPWLDDHKLLPHAVLPGAGYIAMAVEAARQFYLEAEDAMAIKAFKLRNVAINSTMRIPDDEFGIETILNMEAVQLTNANVSSKWLKFSIGSIVPDSENWTEHCSGIISAETQPRNLEHKLSVNRRARSLDMARWYEKFAEKGLGYGSAFRGLSKLQAYRDDNCAAANVALSPTVGNVKGGESYYPLHPTTLDTCFQLCIISCYAGQVEKMDKAFVPVTADEMTIWIPEATAGPDELGHGVCTGEVYGPRGAYVKTQLTTYSGAPLVDISQMRFVAYDGAPSLADEVKLPRDPYVRSVSKVDIDSLSDEKARIMFPPKYSTHVTSSLIQKFDKLCAYIVANLPTEEQHWIEGEQEDNHQAFRQWARSWREQASKGGVLLVQEAITASDIERLEVINDLVIELQDVPEVRAIKQLYDNLDRIFNMETNSVKVLLEGGLLQSLSSSGICIENAYLQLQNTVDLLAHKNPQMRILEIGAGSGGATRRVLDTLAARTTFKRFQDYTFTDASGWCITDARTTFADYNGLGYGTLDMNVDPVDQGFEEEYDLIIASEVLTETEDVSHSLINARKLLKVGGKMVIVELTAPHLGYEIIFRTMTGRWADADIPYKNRDGWNEALAKAGFSGVDICLDDYPDECGLRSVMLSTAMQSEPAGSVSKDRPDIYLLYQDYPHPLGRAIERHLTDRGLHVVYTDFLKCDIPQGSMVISALDIDGVTLTSCDEKQFVALQSAVMRASTVLWLSPGCPNSGYKPESAIMKGMLRSAATENILMKIAYIELDQDCSNSFIKTGRVIARTALQLHHATAGDGSDREFVLRGGVLHVERLLPDEPLNEQFQLRHGSEGELEDRPMDSEGPLRAKYEQPGVLSSLCFEADQDLLKPLEADSVEIETKAIGLNVKNLAVATGKFDSSFLSSEVSGIVSKVGAGVTSVRLGDRVFGLVPANMGNYTRSKASLLQKIDSKDSFSAAASMPVVYLTAIYALQHVARIGEGESVLIQSAAGGLGMALMRLARHLGAEIYATVGNSEKKKLLVEEFGVAEDHIFSSRELSAVDELMRATEGKGIDVIIGSAGGDTMHETWRCIAPLGRFIDVGRTAVLGSGTLGMEVFKRNASFTSFDLELVYKQKPQLIARLTKELKLLWRDGIIGPIDHIKTFDISQLEQAMMYFSKGVHTGKVVITYDDPKTSLRIARTPSRASFDSNATYLLVGCLGGLGRSLATWMIQRGAKHLAFMSRSGASSPDASSLIDDLHAMGASPSVIQCSVTDSIAVKSAITTLTSSAHPLKGILHAAMVEGDAFFSRASHSKIQSVLAPKVTGSLNLHNATAHLPLDFFLMTSSVVATIGTSTQGAYSAANTFQDALARHRRSLGLPAISLALGLILEVGSVSALPAWLQTLQRTATYGISETEFLQLLEGAMATPAPDSVSSHVAGDPLSPAHLIVGLEPSRLADYVTNGGFADLTWRNDARFSALVQAMHDRAQAKASVPKADANSVGEQIKAAGTVAEEKALALKAIVERLGKLVSVPEDEIDPGQPMLRYGLDSMVAAELRNWLIKTFGVEVGFLMLLGKGVSIEGVAGLMVGEEMKA